MAKKQKNAVLNSERETQKQKSPPNTKTPSRSVTGVAAQASVRFEKPPPPTPLPFDPASRETRITEKIDRPRKQATGWGYRRPPSSRAPESCCRRPRRVEVEWAKEGMCAYLYIAFRCKTLSSQLTESRARGGWNVRFESPIRLQTGFNPEALRTMLRFAASHWTWPNQMVGATIVNGQWVVLISNACNVYIFYH